MAWLLTMNTSVSFKSSCQQLVEVIGRMLQIVLWKERRTSVRKWMLACNNHPPPTHTHNLQNVNAVGSGHHQLAQAIAGDVSVGQSKDGVGEGALALQLKAQHVLLCRRLRHAIHQHLLAKRAQQQLVAAIPVLQRGVVRRGGGGGDEEVDWANKIGDADAEDAVVDVGVRKSNRICQARVEDVTVGGLGGRGQTRRANKITPLITSPIHDARVRSAGNRKMQVRVIWRG